MRSKGFLNGTLERRTMETCRRAKEELAKSAVNGIMQFENLAVR